MANSEKKTDLRVKKTRRAIRSAFLELAHEKPMEKITVKELSERAEINKATFYSHYETIYALIDELEQEAVDMVIDRMKDAKSLTEDPRSFVYELADALCASSLALFVSTSSYRQTFQSRLLAALQEVKERRNLDPRDYEQEGVLMSFLILGLTGTQQASPGLTQRHLDVIADLVAEGVGGVSFLRQFPPGQQ